MVCFVHVDFEMCFGPQRRALFWTSQVPEAHRSWSALYILTSKFALRPSSARFFNRSTSKKGLRNVPAFKILTSKCGSRHSRVQFLISHPTRWLRTHRFSEPFFSLLEPQSNWNTQCFATFLPFRTPAPSFFWLLLFSIFSLLRFSSLTRLTSAFPSVHIVGSLTSKLHSIMTMEVFSIFPYCRKFDFQTSFDNDNESVWKCVCQLLFSQFEVLQPQGWQPYSLCFARGIAKAPRSPPTVVLCCRHRRWCWQPSRSFEWVCWGLFQAMLCFVDGGYAVSGGCVCVFPLCLAP